MTHTLTFRDGIFRVETSGEMEVKGFLAYYEEMLSHQEWRPGGRLIADHRGLGGLSLDVSKPFDKTSLVAGFFKRNEDRIGNMILATVLPDSDAGALISLWDSIRGFLKVEVRFKAFYALDEAEAWVRSCSE